jgi:hypothetical protein
MSRLYWKLHRTLMKLAHRYHWHYAPPIHPDGDTVLWCQWCGLRYVKSRRGTLGEKRVRPAFYLEPDAGGAEREP